MTDTTAYGQTPKPKARPKEVSCRLHRFSKMADALDSRFRIPGTSIRFGWDSILGLVPGRGALVTVAPAAIQIAEGYRMGARKRTLARMGTNTALDLIIGGVPLIGDVFDVFFKSNKRNLALLHKEFGQDA